MSDGFGHRHAKDERADKVRHRRHPQGHSWGKGAGDEIIVATTLLESVDPVQEIKGKGEKDHRNERRRHIFTLSA
ncbi:MAG: hypothetical protein M0C28_43810 [Candidatus Moduliflexus flocculans]|nr:hypothetical protein [Candidatus Moduliflexus flocculans]